ncbi:MAG: diacylglycerol kinase [Planctomycetaceae bacterium]
MQSRSEQRPGWRQRLVDCERGLSQSFRGDSTLFGYCFVASVTVTAGLVVGIGVLEWAVVILAMCVAASTEMFQMVLRSIGDDLGERLSRPTRKALQIGTAAVLVTRLGATFAIAAIYIAAIRQMW